MDIEEWCVEGGFRIVGVTAFFVGSLGVVHSGCFAN